MTARYACVGSPLNAHSHSGRGRCGSVVFVPVRELVRSLGIFPPRLSSTEVFPDADSASSCAGASVCGSWLGALRCAAPAANDLALKAPHSAARPAGGRGTTTQASRALKMSRYHETSLFPPFHEKGITTDYPCTTGFASPLNVQHMSSRLTGKKSCHRKTSPRCGAYLVSKTLVVLPSLYPR